MDLKIKNCEFVVIGGTSGFGLSIVNTLVKEGAKVTVNARGKEKLNQLEKKYPNKITGIEGDIILESTQKLIQQEIKGKFIGGIVLNAAGPPTGNFIDIDMKGWDHAYNLVTRWKISFLQMTLPHLLKQKYGRVIFIESMSVKQPINQLILSNVFRMAVVGLSKSLSMEYASKGITFNVLAPGLHDTPASERVINKRAKLAIMDYTKMKEIMADEIPVKRLGNPDELGMIAAWLLSEHSGFITGQTFSIDGGVITSTFG